MVEDKNEAPVRDVRELMSLAEYGKRRHYSRPGRVRFALGRATAVHALRSLRAEHLRIPLAVRIRLATAITLRQPILRQPSHNRMLGPQERRVSLGSAVCLN